MADNGTHSDFDLLLIRYLSGELSPGMQERVEQELEADPGKRKLLEEYRRIWDASGAAGEESSYDLDAEWDRIRPRLPGFGAVPGRKSRHALFYVYRIAAVLVIGLVLAVAWTYMDRFAGTRRVAAGSDPVEVRLQDGSTVTLNRHSRIRYPKRPGDMVRKVRLTGEAWFEVVADPDRPFVVDAGTAVVEVLGTSFNVNAYRKNQTVEIIVESGMVALSSKKEQQAQIILNAGNRGAYHKESRQLELIPGYDPNQLSWKTRELFFENDALSEVARLLEEVYGVGILFRNPELAECRITVTFRDQSLDAVLNVLASTLDLEISRSAGQVVLDGTGCTE